MQVIDHTGRAGKPQLFTPEKLMAALNAPETKEVRVFRLKPGMVLNVQGARYKVVTVRPNGKATIKPL